MKKLSLQIGFLSLETSNSEVSVMAPEPSFLENHTKQFTQNILECSSLGQPFQSQALKGVKYPPNCKFW